ncbi:MAG TPA: AraC family transcriptional regulator [Spirochaetia bacterium]|nr:AraC family transcriptional regulator [Spirochaetia bacterium]
MALVAFGCGIVVLFFALAQLTIGSHQPLQVCIAVSCLAATWVLLYIWADAEGLIRSVPVLANTDNSAVLIAAPGFYLGSLTILHEGKRPVRSYLAYFVPPGIVAAGGVVYGALTAPAFLSAHGVIPNHYSSPFLAGFTLGSDLVLVIAIILDLLAALRLLRAGRVQDRAGFNHQLMFLHAYLAAAVTVVVGTASGSRSVYVAGCVAAGLIVVAFALSRTVVFYYANDRLGPRLRQRKPEWDGSSEELAGRLAALMEKEAPYRDETLTLRRLAGMLGERPERLSYYLNAGLSRSFRSYISDLRLESVCRDLLADPRRSILNVAFANGFNSKSSFNTLFFQKYGKTPKEFRREKLSRL